MKRLRASEQGDSAAPVGDPGAAVDPNATSIKAALGEKPANSQTGTVSTLPLPAAAGQEEQPQPRCNGDIPQMLPQRKLE